jgi:hypothetical protein
MRSRVRIAPETTLLLWKSAAFGRKTGEVRGAWCEYAASAARANGRGGRCGPPPACRHVAPGSGRRVGSVGAGGELLEHLLAGGSTEYIARTEILVLGGDPGVANQGQGGLRRFGKRYFHTREVDENPNALRRQSRSAVLRPCYRRFSADNRADRSLAWGNSARSHEIPLRGAFPAQNGRFSEAGRLISGAIAAEIVR